RRLSLVPVPVIRRLELCVDVQHPGQPRLEAPPRRGLGVAVEGLLAVRPAEFAVLTGHAPGAGRGGLYFEQGLELARQHLALGQYALLAVERRRSRIEVVAADE